MRITASMKDEMMYAALHQRAYAAIFDWVQPDRERAKRVKEKCIVDDFIQARYRYTSPYGPIESCKPPLPDCQAVDRAGRKIGFEVTELVDQRMIEWHKNPSNPTCWKDYSAEDLFSAVVERLLTKNRNLRVARSAIREAGLERIMVIVHCDEPDLIQRPAFCREAFASREFPQFSEIDEAYLLLPCPRKKHLYDDEAEFCQLVPIPIGAGK
jgi:hypothetical protein